MKPPSTRTKTLALLLTAALLTGCGSTLTYHGWDCRHPAGDGLRPPPPDPHPVYVTNPELTREYEILRTSGIYNISPRPADARALTLRPLQQYGGCGMPLIGSAITLGVIPINLPAYYTFAYDLENNGQIESRVHRMQLNNRISIWEWCIRSDDDQVLAQALAWSSAESRPGLQGFLSSCSSPP